MKPWHIALAYVALTVLALALPAVPLFDAWRVHVGPLRVFVPQDMQALPELFRREGADAVAAAVRSRSDPSGREVIVFAGPGKEVLAGTLRRWPTEIPDAPGTYGQVIDRGDGSLMRIIVSHEVLPGGYQLIMGRQGEGLSLQGHFGYGIAAAMMIVLALGTALAWLLARSASAARAAEERYARAMEASEEAHWDWIIPTDEYYAARSHFHVYGLPADFQYAGRAQFLAAAPFHLEDRAKYTQAVNALFASRESRLTMDMRLLLGGETRWVQIRGMCTRDASGAPVRYTGTVRDITDRKRLDLALGESEARFRSLTELSSDFFWETDAEHRYTAIELGWAYAGVRNQASKLGRARWEIAYASPDEAAWAAHRAAIAARSRFVDFRFSRIEEGEERFYEHSGEPRCDAQGNFLGYRGVGRDVTARKRAEMALRKSEERYARVMQASEDGFWEWVVATDEFYASPRMLALYGLPPDTVFRGRADFLSRFPFHPEDLELWRKAVAAHLAGETARVDLEVRSKWQRETRWIHLTAICLRDASGAEERWTGSVSDVTERRRAQEALRASEERYSLAMEASEEGHFDVNLDTDEHFISERLNEIHGFPPGRRTAKRSEFIKQIRFYGDDARKYHAAMAAAEAKDGPERHECEFRIVRPSGEVRWLRTRGKVARDAEGRARRRTGVVSDITERKLAEEELRESAARFRGLTELSSDWYWEQDENLRFTYLSNQAAQLTGYSGESSLGKTRWEIENMEPLSCSWAEHQALLAARQPFRDLECRRIGSDGTVRYLSMSGAPVFDEGGRFKGYQGIGRNITERKRAEEKLRESEALKSAMFETALDCIISIDHDGRVIEFNPAAERTFGYRRAEAMGKELAELIIPPRLRDRHRRGLARYLATGEGPVLGTRVEMSAVRADGAEFPVELSVTRIPAEGAPLFTAYLRDITERKRAEEKLRESEARYARAMDASADGLWEWNAASDELFISPRARELWGIPDGVEIRTRAELKAQNLQFTEDTIRECIAQRSGVEMTYSVLDQAGELRWVRSVGKVFLGEHGEPMRVTGSLTDVTERKLAADALRLSEEELRARQDMLDLAQKAASAVAFAWHIGAGEGENRWSPDLEAMYGLEPGSYDGTYESWKTLVFPGDWPAVEAAIKRASETGDVAAEYRVVHPGGAVHRLQARGRMFFDDERKATRVVGFMLDVTDRHQAEEELHRLERQLRQAQRLEAMGTLAGGIAHDFNNILGAILGYGEMAMRDAPKGSRLARDLDSIIVAGERGRALVDRVLAFSRSGVGERVPVHVETVVREALDFVSAKLPPNVALRVNLRAGRAAMLGDATQVHQVVMNLVTNAIQAMLAGGMLRVSLGVTRLESARVPTIGIIDPGEYLVLEVADTGTGIPPNVLERIFDPFFTTKEVGTGTGLGLSLVHGIVAELGGAIDVASTPGAGSTFTVYLPRVGETVDARQDEEPEMPRGEGQRVLIVDDEEPLVRLATRTLEELGYAPVGFTSSSAALAAFRADPQRFDALITDERMPGMSGSALIREVRGIRGAMPVVLMSGYLGAVAGKADEVLQKPLSARDLAASLARVLRL